MSGALRPSRVLAVVGLLAAGALLGCPASRAGTRARDRHAKSDSFLGGGGSGSGDDDDRREPIAGSDDWVAPEGFGAAMRVPSGWNFGVHDGVAYGHDPDMRAAFILVGAESPIEARRSYDGALGAMKMELGASSLEKRTVVMQGIAFERQDYEKATVNGKPARGLALVADAPKRDGGLLVLVGYAIAGDAKHQQELDAAIATLSRE